MKKLFFAAAFLLLANISFSKDLMNLVARNRNTFSKSYAVFISRTDSAYKEIELDKGDNGIDLTNFLVIVKRFENNGWKIINISVMGTADNFRPTYVYTLEK